MALDLLRLQRLFGAAPPPFRLVGRVLALRAPERQDWQAWAELREASRAFLTPWEPLWSDDALTRAAFRRRLARYAFEWHSDQGYTFLLFRVEAACLPHNVPSRALLRKAGFREEGYAREYLCINGKWQDHVLFGLLASEWQKRKPGA